MTTNFTLPQEELEQLLEQSSRQEIILWGKELVVSYRLPSGNPIVGHGVCLDPENFDLEKGREAAKADAIKKLGQPEAYLRQSEKGKQAPDATTQELLQNSEIQKYILDDVVAIVACRLSSGFVITGEALLNGQSIEEGYQQAQENLVAQLQYLEGYRKMQSSASEATTTLVIEAPCPPEESESEPSAPPPPPPAPAPSIL